METPEDQKEAFLQAYDQYADAIYRHCYFRVYQAERARDLTQETFTRTWQAIVRGQRIENMRAFLYRVANNLVIDESRKKKEASLDALLESGYEPSAPSDERKLMQRLEVNIVLEKLDILDEKHRTVFLMRYVDGLQPDEIAVILGETANAVSVRLHRTIEKLRSLLPHD